MNLHQSWFGLHRPHYNAKKLVSASSTIAKQKKDPKAAQVEGRVRKQLTISANL